jgi:hypothetical protein
MVRLLLTAVECFIVFGQGNIANRLEKAFEIEPPHPFECGYSDIF